MKQGSFRIDRRTFSGDPEYISGHIPRVSLGESHIAPDTYWQGPDYCAIWTVEYDLEAAESGRRPEKQCTLNDLESWTPRFWKRQELPAPTCAQQNGGNRQDKKKKCVGPPVILIRALRKTKPDAVGRIRVLISRQELCDRNTVNV